MNEHPCPKPTPKRRKKNTLWICECGQGYVCREKYDYCGNVIYYWMPWPGVN